MRPLDKFPEEYFLKYKTKPVKLKPFNPKQKRIANHYINKLRDLLKDFEVKLMIRGSTAFEILGKGDIEIGVYPEEKDWKQVISKLKDFFGEPENVEKDYVRFNDKKKEIEAEIIVLKGYEAKVDMRLTEYLTTHSALLKQYIQLKKKYTFSKREYQRQKSKFFAEVTRMIPERGRTS